MSKVKKWLVPLAILVITLVIAMVILNNPPESRRGGPSKASQLTVEVSQLKPERYTVVVDTFGTVQPRTQSALVAQVSGQINYVSPQFRNGGFFAKGDVLLKLDQRDYFANVKIAGAKLLSAEQTLLEEKANTTQANIDWKRLGKGKVPSDLVLRKPQLAVAKANLLSAQAGLTIAKLALERTEIKAPYGGRILEQQVDFGQVVATNSQVAEIYSTDSVEIRLPINNSNIDLVNFPEQFSSSNNAHSLIEVRFTSSLSKNQTWLGKVIRTEGAIDSNSHQLYIVAQIEDPYNRELHPGASIKIGQYVQAEVQGKTLNDAIVISNSTIYQGSYVYVVKEGLLARRNINIRWQNSQNAIIESGLSAGELLVTTPLGQVSSGTRVSIAGEPTPTSPRQRKPSGEREAKLQQMAKKMGITVKELRAKHKAQGPNSANTHSKSNN